MPEPAGNDESLDAELAALEVRINALLPPRYVGCFEGVPPTSMGSAALRYDAQGRVAWGSIWTTFCHLALAGGPPHRGRWLGPVAKEEAEAAPEAYAAVVAELERALRLCVDLPPCPTRRPGWIGLTCEKEAVASWLVRAITAENVAARHEGPVLLVPAGPHFRIEKEMKNVVVSTAKTCHYLLDHLEPDQQPSGPMRPLIGPSLPEEIGAVGERYAQAAVALRGRIEQATGLSTVPSDAPGWIGIACDDAEAAVWLLRAVAVEDVLVRREEATLFVPVDLGIADATERTAAAVAQAHRLRQRRK